MVDLRIQGLLLYRKLPAELFLPQPRHTSQTTIRLSLRFAPASEHTIAVSVGANKQFLQHPLASRLQLQECGNLFFGKFNLFSLSDVSPMFDNMDDLQGMKQYDVSFTSALGR
jgi:hypothetical protein